MKFLQKISALDIAIFFRQLATLTTAGIPIIQSFEIIKRSQEKIPLKKLIHSVKNEIEEGQNLVHSFKKFPDFFDHLTCHLIHVGEQTGKIDTIFQRIAHYKEKSLALKKQIKRAIFYPALVFMISSIISILMLTCVVPRFAELFREMHGSLPYFTKLVITLSDLCCHNLWLGIFPIILVIFFSMALKKSIQLKQQIDQLLIHIPVIGNAIKKIILARLSRSLAITFAAGVPLTDALKIVATACGNSLFTKQFMILRSRIISGEQLHHAMQSLTLFPIMLVQMIKIGEESGTLDQMLEKIADLYESDIEQMVALLSQLLEPLIMVILGVLIGGLVIAMYLPIFKLGTVI